MAIVQQLTKQLLAYPEEVPLPWCEVRTFAGAEDIAAFLRLRERAFAHQKVGVRSWSVADFEAEISSKPWWTPERTWFAVPRSEQGNLRASELAQPVGTVALAQRGIGPQAMPAIHWLAVDPRWRRRGVAKLLIAHLEAYCWREGFRTICLETHAAWTAAAACYESLGYRPA